MKKLIAFFLVASILLLSSCTSAHSQFHGVWYRDANGERIAVQFSENDDGKNVFIWATYDIESDEVKSISKGYYKVSGNNITLDYESSDADINLTYTIEGNKLTLSSDTVSLVLTKFELS